MLVSKQWRTCSPKIRRGCVRLEWRPSAVLAMSCSVPSASETCKRERGKCLLPPSCRCILTQVSRQCNMDYLFASSVIGFRLPLLQISYDVACQWFVNFWKRMRFLPSPLRLNVPQSAVKPMVPKFHLQSHTEVCHAPYAFNYTEGGARTDGEGVERNWKGLNGQAPSTSEMGAGARYDTLDDCCGHMNWRKTVGMGE